MVDGNKRYLLIAPAPNQDEKATVCLTYILLKNEQKLFKKQILKNWMGI